MEQKETLDIDDSSHELNVIKQTTKQNIRYNREYLLSYVKENNIVLLQEYSGNINRKTTIISECLNDECENSSSKTYVQFLKSGSYCKVCTCKNSRKKMEATNMERYGVKHPSQNPGVKEKIEATNMERYGVKNPFQDPGVKEKIEATNMERYGVKHPSQNPTVREKMEATNMERYGVKNPSQDPGVKEKMEATNMERYGVKNPSQNPTVREKMEATNMERYGVKHPSQDPGVKEKIEATNMERYGVKNPSQNPGVKEKMEATNMERYGVKHPSQDPGVREKMEATNIKRYGAKHHMQNSEVSEKASHNAYKAYDYMFPSGKTIRLQGYEKFAVDDLLSQNISEDDIITKRTEVPKCEYKDSDGNVHRYYVDILIKSQKFCIEVKSIWTLEKNKDKVVFTKKALEDLGYRCEIWVYDGKGVRIQTI